MKVKLLLDRQVLIIRDANAGAFDIERVVGNGKADMNRRASPALQGNRVNKIVWHGQAQPKPPEVTQSP